MIKFLVPALPIGTLLAVSCATSAQAQETSSKTDDGLETVIVEAQKMQEGSIGGWIPVPLPELPRTVTIIDEDIWTALMHELGANLPPSTRRANLMVDRDADKKTPAEAACWLDPQPCAQP